MRILRSRPDSEIRFTLSTGKTLYLERGEVEELAEMFLGEMWEVIKKQLEPPRPKDEVE